MSRNILFVIPFFAAALYAPLVYADGVLGTTAISAEKTYAQADGDFAHGWKWTFGVTVPTDEPVLSMKFGNWIGSSTSFSSAGNARFYSAQSSNANSISNAIKVDTADAYGSAMNLLPSTNASFDLSTSTPGRQIEITVEVRVPIGATGGSYTTTYGIMTNPDTTAPVISLLGSPSVTVERTSVYTDAGATASDNIDGNISSNIILSGTVTSSSVGTYLLSYHVSDAAGNAASPVTRTVFVQDTVPPTATVSYSTTTPTNTDVIATLHPSEPVTVTNNNGATTTTFTNNGSFTFEFADFASNLSSTTPNNMGSTTASVSNIDKTAPFVSALTLNGATNNVAVNTTSTSIAIALTASEAVNWLSVKVEKQDDASVYKIFFSGSGCIDGGVTCSKTWTGDLSSAGMTTPDGVYRIKAHLKNSAGNEFDNYGDKTITIDTTPPVITVTGGTEVTQNVGTVYTDAGATAVDARDDAVSVSSSGSVDANTIGVYTVTYTAADALGNTATAARTVHIVPVLMTSVTIDGSHDITVNNNSTMPLSYTFIPSNATNQTVTWSVSHNSNGTGLTDGSTIDQNGVLHIHTIDSGERIYARATTNDGSNLFDQIIVHINP